MANENIFISAEEYIRFFKEVKNKAFALKKGDVPELKTYSFAGSCIAYGILFVFCSVFFSLISAFLFALLGWFVLPFFLFGFYWIIMAIVASIQESYYQCQKKKTSFKRILKYNHGAIAAFSRIPYLMKRYPQVSPCQNTKQEPPAISIHPDEFALFIGKSTGLMSGLWHTSGLAEDQNVLLSSEDACKNILALGGIGSGKTSSIMQPLLLQCLSQGCGGLIFDIKGDVRSTTLSFAKSTNRQIRILKPAESQFNLLGTQTPEIVSSYLKSALCSFNAHSNDSFWIDTAAELSRNVLGLLFFTPQYYTLADLYRYIFDKDAHDFLETKLKKVRESLSPENKRLFDAYHRYKTNVFDSFDEKVKSGVRATLAQAIAPFNHPELADAFCSEGELKIEKILEGEVFLVDMPIARWGLTAKVVYTFIKLMFFNLMQKHHNAENRKLPVFFMCDEFQEIVSCNRDGLSDLNFWDKSRSSKTIGIISAQSISSFFAATPNRDYAYALLQNFRNKLCLASEDPLTIDYISQLIGQAKTLKVSESSHGNTISEVRDSVLEAQVFRSLSPQSALTLLTINNHSRDDALKLYPIFLKQDQTQQEKNIKKLEVNALQEKIAQTST